MSRARSVSQNIKFRIMERDNYTCVYCGEKCIENELNIDHIVPYSKGGVSDINNLATSCISCNREKYNNRHEREAEILELVKLRNKELAYFTNKDVLERNKVDPIPNRYHVRKGWKVRRLVYNEVKDRELIVKVATQYMTTYDKRLYLETISKGEFYRLSGVRQSCIKTFCELELNMIGLTFSDFLKDDKLRYFSKLHFRELSFKCPLVESVPDGDYWSTPYQLCLLKGFGVFEDTKEVHVNLDMREADKFLNLIIDNCME